MSEVLEVLEVLQRHVAQGGQHMYCASPGASIAEGY